MEIPFLTKHTGRIIAVAAPILFAGALLAQDGTALAGKELEKRLALVQEGQMFLEKGDDAYNAGRFQDATDAYSAARSAFPDAPATADLRDAATRRLILASVEYGRELSRKGDVAGAKAVVEKVLDKSVAPDDSYALAFRSQLDDPIRTNPALTKEHAEDVDEVRRLLYTAQGAYDLGKHDEAGKHYQSVLRIDPYNKAARRGMELVASAKSDYMDSARDHARAETLGEVDAAWELGLAPDLVVPALPDLVSGGGGQAGFVPVSNKLSRIIVPEFRIVQGTLMEAVELLRLRATENDKLSSDPAQKGINITVNLGDPTVSPAKEILAKNFDLQVANVPVDAILKYLTEISGTTYRTDDFAVTIIPAGFQSDELMSRVFRVPPDFLSNLSAGSNAEKQENDIFNTEVGNGGLLAARMGAQEALAQQGVTFPDGASAMFNAASNTLRVINTAGNLDIIAQIIDSITQTEPVSVAVRVTMLKVQQDRLEELGFDWMLDNFGFGGNSWIPGADKLNLTGGTTSNGTAITDIAPLPGATFPTNPITAGNRSGNGAFAEQSIDALIAAGSTGGRQSTNRAPGVLGLNGILGNATVQVLMRGLNQQKGVDLMSQPSVTTRSGQAASIQLIREFIYPTEYEPPELPNSGGGTIAIDPAGNITAVANTAPNIVIPATPTAFEKRDVGVSLEVLPVADANRRYVDVTLNPVITDFDGFVNYGSPINSTSQGLAGPVTVTLTENQILMPVFSVQRANTNVVVADGSTIVIGGLLKDEIANLDDKTPILGDIPVVGRLFKSEGKSQRSIAIVFLVNVELLDPTGRPYRDR
ncbi:type II and III secretion system protein [Akkermansiaceae bacterium]|nr:type II and III secretion system protein [Akkermansiaceae bacterium]